MRILLDAGHGYNTPGKRSPDGMREYEFNRVVANYAKALLEEHENVTVHFSHSDHKDVSLQERANKANRLAADCFVSIHANAYGSSWNSANGIETYVYTSRPKGATELAERVQHNLVVATGLRNRGVKTGNFHVLKATKMTAILVECGFMTNKEEVKLLRSDIYRKTCAEAIVKAIREQYKLKRKSKVQPPTKQLEYHVHVGPFQGKNEARQLVEKMKREGFQARLSEE